MTAGPAKSGTQLFWFFQIFRTIPKIRNSPKDNHEPYPWVLFTFLHIKDESNLDQDLNNRKACIKKKYDQIQLVLIKNINTSLERGDCSDFHDTNV